MFPKKVTELTNFSESQGTDSKLIKEKEKKKKEEN